MSNEWLPGGFTRSSLTTTSSDFSSPQTTPTPYYSHSINLRVTEKMVDVAIIAGGFEHRLNNADVRQSMRDALEAALELLAKG